MAEFPTHVEVKEQGLQTLRDTFKSAYKQIVNEIDGATNFGVQNRKQILSQIDRHLTDLGVDVNAFVKQEIPTYYKLGANQAVEQLQYLGAEVPIKSGFNIVHRDMIANLVNETASSFADSIQTVGRSAQALLGKKVREEIRQQIATGVIQGSTLPNVTKQIKQILADEGLSALVDKNGRHWQLDTYAEMLFRTKTVEARNMGLANRMLENGYDLVQVSIHFSTHEACRVWEGKILSMTGNTPGYPTVDQATEDGLFHPNCRHAINALAPDLAAKTLAWNPITKKYEPGGGLTLAQQLGNE